MSTGVKPMRGRPLFQYYGQHVRKANETDATRVMVSADRVDEKEFEIFHPGDLINPIARFNDYRIWGLLLLVYFSALAWAFIIHAVMNVGLLDFLDFSDRVEVSFLFPYVGFMLSLGISSSLKEAWDVFRQKMRIWINLSTELRVFIDSLCAYRSDSGLADPKSDGLAIDIVSPKEWDEMQDRLENLIDVYPYIFLDDSAHMFKPKHMELRREIKRNDVAHRGVPITLYAGTPELAIDQLLGEVMVLTSKWIQNGCVTGFGYRTDFVDKCRALVSEMTTVKFVRSYSVFQYILAFAVAFNLFILPVMVWFHLRSGLMYYYPVVVFTFLTVTCHNIWLGDPFEGSWATRVDHVFTRDRLHKRLEIQFNAFRDEEHIKRRAALTRRDKKVDATGTNITDASADSYHEF